MFSALKSNITRALPKNSFVRNVGILASGTAGAQAILIACVPFLTRLYAPEDFGMIAVYMSLLALLGILSGLRYELAIPLPEEEVEAANLLALSLILISITSSLSLLIVCSLATPIADLLGIPALSNHLWLLPIGVGLAGVYRTFNYWAIRQKNFSAVSGTQIKQAIAIATIQLACFKLGGLGLILGQTCSQGIGCFSLSNSALSSGVLKRVSRKGIWEAACRYRRFPLFSTTAGFTRTAGVQLPPLVLASFFSPAATGLYMLADRVLSKPMSLISNAVGSVFYSEAAGAYRANKLGPLVEQLHHQLAHIGFAPALLVLLLGPDLFSMTFGADWTQAGVFAQWMTPWLYLVFVSSSITSITAVTDRQKEGLYVQLVLLLLRMGAILLGVKTGDLTTTIIIFALANACWRLLFLAWLARLASSRLKSLMSSTLSAAGIALICTSPVIVTLTFSTAKANLWKYALIASTILIFANCYRLLKNLKITI